MALARQAGESTLPYFRSVDLEVEQKDDDTPVTEADRGAERLLRKELPAEAFPDDAIIGEEEDATAGTSGRTWIVDPIDGTKAFTHGVPLYSTLLAAADEHGPLLGVICLPALPETVWAGRGLGCFLDGQPCHVSDARHREAPTSPPPPSGTGPTGRSTPPTAPAPSSAPGATPTATRSWPPAGSRPWSTTRPRSGTWPRCR